jgi:hypothetical protein
MHRRQAQQQLQRELKYPRHFVIGDGWMLKAGCDYRLCRQGLQPWQQPREQQLAAATALLAAATPVVRRRRRR